MYSSREESLFAPNSENSHKEYRFDLGILQLVWTERLSASGMEKFRISFNFFLFRANKFFNRYNWSFHSSSKHAVF